MPGAIELILADSNPLMLQALSEIFERDRRFSLVATAKTAEGFLEASLRAPVPVAVTDWWLPELGAERLLARLRERPNPPRIVIYASGADQAVARRAMTAGAAGFCTRDTPPEQLLEIVTAVAAGRMVFPFLDVRSLKRDPREELTGREKALLSALAQGRTNAELAVELGISINTVKFHLRNLYEKLGLRNRSQAIAFHYSDRPDSSVN